MHNVVLCPVWSSYSANQEVVMTKAVVKRFLCNHNIVLEHVPFRSSILTESYASCKMTLT